MSLVQCMSDEAVRWDAGEYDAGGGRQKGLWRRYWKQTLNYVPKIGLTSTFVPKDYVTH